MNVSLILPVFNEKQNIIQIIKELQNVLNNIEYEIIIVDDNSPDGTYGEIIKNYGKDKNVKVFLRKNERGLGSAILQGINNSKYQIIIGMDADFNHPPELIPKMLAKVGEYDLVIASRFIKGGGMENKKRYYLTYLFNWFLKHALKFPIMDNMSGFYAVKKEKLLKLPLERIYKGYGDYHLRLVYLAGKNSLSIKEIPVFYKKRLYGKSKSNLPKLFFIYLKEACRLRFYEKNFRIQNSGV
jgi:dolichol-phosphate mannosyltransferase